jgi:hypothetical protein
MSARRTSTVGYVQYPELLCSARSRGAKDSSESVSRSGCVGQRRRSGYNAQVRAQEAKRDKREGTRQMVIDPQARYTSLIQKQMR